MKFDLFNEDTHIVSPELIQEQINNKAIGSITNMIGEIKALARRIEERDKIEQDLDYIIARDLLRDNPKAAEIMGLIIRSSDFIATVVLETCYQVIRYWDKEDRNRWRDLMSKLRLLKTYIGSENHSRWGGGTIHAVDKHLKATVEGNAAWKVYLEAENNRRGCLETINSLLRSDRENESNE